MVPTCGKDSEKHLVEVFGKAGHIFYNFARGIAIRPVITYRERKSVGCEQTFLEDISAKSAVVIELYHTVMESSGAHRRRATSRVAPSLESKVLRLHPDNPAAFTRKDLKKKASVHSSQAILQLVVVLLRPPRPPAGPNRWRQAHRKPRKRQSEYYANNPNKELEMEFKKWEIGRFENIEI